MNMYTLLYLKWITNKNHYIEHRTLLNIMWQPGWEESWWESGYLAEYLHCSPGAITILLIDYTPIQSKMFLKIEKNPLKW